MTPRIKRAAEEASDGYRPMMLVATILFGLAMIVTGIALLGDEAQLSWLAPWTIVTGGASLIATALVVARPWAWRLATIMLGAPVLLCLAFAVGTVGLKPIATGESAFGLAIALEIACWLSFVMVALVADDRQAHRLDPRLAPRPPRSAVHTPAETAKAAEAEAVSASRRAPVSPARAPASRQAAGWRDPTSRPPIRTPGDAPRVGSNEP